MQTKIFTEQKLEEVSIQLPASKSISNRALIVQALTSQTIELKNLSQAKDTLILQDLLSHDSADKNVGMAGTAARFLCAFLSTKERTFRVDGEERMRQRPMQDLLNALEKLGASINYLDQNGFLPVEINGRHKKGGELAIDASVSSQFVSALMLIAPKLPGGLTIQLLGELVSKPYILMTQSVLAHFGIAVNFSSNSIHIPEQRFIPTPLTIESDWSSASYFYSALCLLDEGSLLLKNLSFNSWQGDEICADIYFRLGIRSTKQGEDVLLEKTGQVTHYLRYDFSDCPDLAQTVICTCVGLGVAGEFSGLHTLRNKETDRISAMQNELRKLNWSLEEKEPNRFLLLRKVEKHPIDLNINTYNDHRMAMAFAPLTICYGQLTIENLDVVNKSFPDFWKEMKKIGVS